MEIVISILGYLVLLTALVSMQVKKMEYLVIFQCVSNALVVAQYLLRGEVTAMGICTLGTVFTLVAFFYNRLDKKVPVYLTAVFAFLGVAVTLVIALVKNSFNPLSDIVPLLAWIVFTVAMMQSKSWIARALMTTNSLLWLTHNIINFDLSLIITYSVLVLFALVGIIRLDRREWRSLFVKEKE